MKNSGIGWVRDIPNDWNVIRGKYVFTNDKTTVGAKVESFERLALTLNGVIKRSKEDNEGLQPINFDNYQILNKNELVFKLIDLQNVSTSRVGLSPFVGIVSPAYIILKAKPSIYPGYAEKYYSMMWMYEVFNALGDCGVRSSLSAAELLEILIPLPPMKTQIAISNFLDIKRDKIKKIIKNLENEIAILNELKKSLTYEMAFGNDAIKKKSTRINYLNEVPYNWDVTKGKYLFKYLQKPILPDDGIITCFRDGQVTLRSNRREEGFTISTKEIGYQGIDIGDLIIHGMDGFAGSIGISDSRGKASPVLNNLDTVYDKRYYMYFLRSLAYKGVFESLSTGIRVRTCDTNWSKIRDLLYAVPPINEQKQISKYLDKKIDEIDKIKLLKTEQIDALINYQKTLFYDYVTGKKEIKI